MVTFEANDIVGIDEKSLQAIAGREEVHSEEEYREFMKNHPLPDGYVWGRTPFGTSPGSWKVYVKEKPDIKGRNTDLEMQLKSLLVDWGYRGYFEHDYRYLGYQLDFADATNKIALEPGAAYWHTPESCRGDTKEGVGETPTEVYSPPAAKDVEKHRALENDGWKILWINEDGIDDDQEVILKWLSRIYD